MRQQSTLRVPGPGPGKPAIAGPTTAPTQLRPQPWHTLPHRLGTLGGVRRVYVAGTVLLAFVMFLVFFSVCCCSPPAKADDSGDGGSKCVGRWFGGRRMGKGITTIMLKRRKADGADARALELERLDRISKSTGACPAPTAVEPALAPSRSPSARSTGKGAAGIPLITAARVASRRQREQELEQQRRREREKEAAKEAAKKAKKAAVREAEVVEEARIERRSYSSQQGSQVT